MTHLLPAGRWRKMVEPFTTLRGVTNTYNKKLKRRRPNKKWHSPTGGNLNSPKGGWQILQPD